LHFVIDVYVIYFFILFRYFKRLLEAKRDPFRRGLILEQIRDVESEILELLQAQRRQIQKENDFMQQALDEYERKKRDGF
jgi:hypothetical protein